MQWLPTTPFFAKPLSDSYSKAKEELHSINFWFRKKYNLAPTDPRYLEMTQEDIHTEYFMHLLEENPEFKLEDLERTTSSDEEWIKDQQREHLNEVLKKAFEGKLEELKKAAEELGKIKPSGLSPLETARNKVKVSLKSKFNKPISLPASLGGDDEFEEIIRETN